MTYPKIIQGGMGVAVSSWNLARAVSMAGQMGVVSGTALDLVLVRRLQAGDPGGHIRQALEHFPIRDIAQRILQKYFVEGGIGPLRAHKSKPMVDIEPSQAAQELLVAGNFVEVWLAKNGHGGVVGINLLEKIQLPTLPSLFGAMMAGVDYVLMGAGIPRHIPAILDRLSQGLSVELPINVLGAKPGEEFFSRFDPRPFLEHLAEPLLRPKFLAIISSATLAVTLARKCTGKVDGFVVEGATAGGHNAPPRGGMKLDEKGEPIYGPRDVADLGQIAELGLPFWLAGSYAGPERLREAEAAGAQGVQIGTAFAFCEESGIAPALKRDVIRRALNQELSVFTDPLCSPTGFPFKVAQVPQTLSEEERFHARNRICDLGYLRTVYRKDDGSLGYRCPSEPVDDFLRKGGDLQETVGRKCVCNGLMATIGLGQVRKDGYAEEPIVTSGDDLVNMSRWVPPGQDCYRAQDVIRFLLGH